MVGPLSLLVALPLLLPSQGPRTPEELRSEIRTLGNKTPDGVFEELCGLRSAEALEALVDGLAAVSQASKRTRAYAAMRRFAGVEGVADEAAGFLLEEARRGNEVLRLHAALRLGALWPDSREELLELALDLDEADARSMALMGLVEHAEEWTAAERGRLARSKDDAVRYEGELAALRAVEDPARREREVSSMLRSRHAVERLAAVELLGSADLPDRLERLTRATEDRDPRVVRKAIDTLGRVREREAVERLMELLRTLRPGLLHRVVGALRALTGEDHGQAPERWERWWGDRPADYRPPAAPTAPTPAAEPGEGTRSSFYGLPLLATEVVFAVDSSDSMKQAADGAGGPSRQSIARDELLRTLDSLPEDAAFDLVDFGKSARSWKGELVDAAPRQRREARAHIEGLGLTWGTEVYGGLREAFRDPRADTVVFLTDGDPQLSLMQDRPTLERIVRQWNRTRHTRVDCISLGGDRPWLRRLAEGSGGRYVKVD
jgi:hypothetical protein